MTRNETLRKSTGEEPSGRGEGQTASALVERKLVKRKKGGKNVKRRGNVVTSERDS